MAKFVDEFLYRGRPPESADPPAWHLIVRTALRDEDGAVVLGPEQLLTMQQAAQQGWALPKIIAEINAGALAEVEGHRLAVAALKGEVEQRDQTIAERDRTIVGLQRVGAERDAAAEQLAADARSLQAALDAAKATIEEMKRAAIAREAEASSAAHEEAV